MSSCEYLTKESYTLAMRLCFHVVTLTFDHLTLNWCSTSGVTWSKILPNCSGIEQSAADILMILKSFAVVTLRCNLAWPLIPLTLKLLAHCIECHVIKLSTKLNIADWVIDDLAISAVVTSRCHIECDSITFSLSNFNGGTYTSGRFSGVREPNVLCQIWGGQKAIIAVHHFVLDLRCLAAFRNAGGWQASGVQHWD